MTSRPIRNNNPLDLEDFGIKWNGQTGVDGQGYCVFGIMEDGLSAGADDVLNAQRMHGRRTIDQIIVKFAPPNENPTDTYKAIVAHDMGIGETDDVDLTAGDNLERMVAAMVKVEGGKDLLALCPPEMIKRVCDQRLGRV